MGHRLDSLDSNSLRGKTLAEMGGARVCLGVLGAEHNTQHPCALL